MPWRDVGDHPNGTAVLEHRNKQLTRAASTFKGGRIGVLKRFARDKKVLDVGCVSHNFGYASGGTGRWLHQHIVDVAGECIGTDYDEAGIKEMREAGYDVVHADITGDLSALIARGPFDVIVAGEIIEHLPAPQALLASARELLRPGGKLVLTTPNPYAPRRVRAGALGLTWENVDHIHYAFPSGMVEMADRTGLVLTRFGTVGWPGQGGGPRLMAESVQVWVQAVARRARGTRATPRRGRFNLPLPVHWLAPMDVLLHSLRGRGRMLGETSVYVLRRTDES